MSVVTPSVIIVRRSEVTLRAKSNLTQRCGVVFLDASSPPQAPGRRLRPSARPIFSEEVSGRLALAKRAILTLQKRPVDGGRSITSE